MTREIDRRKGEVFFVFPKKEETYKISLALVCDYLKLLLLAFIHVYLSCACVHGYAREHECGCVAVVADTIASNFEFL